MKTGRERIEAIIKELTGWSTVRHFKILTDTSDWSRIQRGDIMRLGGDDRFMQGYTEMDDKENRVRIIDFIRGKSFFNHIYEIAKPHEQYYFEDLPGILRNLMGCIEAIGFLHRPYISDRLSDILLHFTIRPKVFYADMNELIEDFEEMLATDFPSG